MIFHCGNDTELTLRNGNNLILNTEHYTQCAHYMHSVHCILYTAHSTQHTAHSTQHTSHITQHTAHSTQHTAHSVHRLAPI